MNAHQTPPEAPAQAHDRREEPARGGGGDLDVLVVGAGLSGVCAAHHLRASRPGRSFAILEARDAIGGTWDLFRYPGIRSDSDIQTLGYGFRPWRGAKSITDGPSILRYIRETAEDLGLAGAIRFRHKAVAASWDSRSARWTVDVEVGAAGDGAPPARAQLRCRYLFLCTGYYDYDAGHMPSWPGMERFEGQIVHPQAWPEGLDHAGRRVVVIGSGATAVTLVPELARTAAHVTMLQRSPSYVVSMPAEDRLANWLAARLPAGAAHGLTRWKNILFGMYVYQMAQRAPEKTKQGIRAMLVKELGPDFDVETHFTPRYDPWDQRLCLVPDSDLFHALRDGSASMATDEIEAFTPRGLALRSGREIEADLVVAATGLRLKLAGGMTLRVDGAPVEMARSYCYKGAMYTGVPNLSLALGYTSASWTLKCDLIARYVVRLLDHMDARGLDYGVPRPPEGPVSERPTINLTSGYIQRGADLLPRQTTRAPWRLNQNYLADLRLLRFGRVDDHMTFGRAEAQAEAGAEPGAASAA